MRVYDDYIGRVVIEFEENNAIEILMNSAEFKQFYDRERKRGPRKIFWRLVPWIKNERMASHIDNSDNSKIYIKNFPVPKVDKCIAAHEIMHLILKKEGDSVEIYSRTRSPNKEFAQVLKSMFEDPIINSFLENEYKFDVLNEYRKDLLWSKNEHDEGHIDPVDEIENLLKALDISYQVLKWNRIADQKAQHDWSEFEKSLKEWYPKAFARSEEILAIVEQYGSETIGESRISAQKIIEKYNLGKIVSFDPREL